MPARRHQSNRRNYAKLTLKLSVPHRTFQITHQHQCAHCNSKVNERLKLRCNGTYSQTRCNEMYLQTRSDGKYSQFKKKLKGEENSIQILNKIKTIPCVQRRGGKRRQPNPKPTSRWMIWFKVQSMLKSRYEVGFTVGACNAMHVILWDLRWSFAMESRFLQQTWSLQHCFPCNGRICSLGCTRLQHF